MNIIIPLTKLEFINYSGYSQPVLLIEENGYPLINYFINNLKQIDGFKNYVFIVSMEDCLNHKIDKVIKVILPEAKIKILNDKTKGAPCSILMAIDMIDKTDQTIILNADQFFDFDLNKKLKQFIDLNSDAGVFTFEAIHPRWSYIIFDEDNNEVIQAEEKNPISKNAIAGFYYFKNFELFFKGSLSAILDESFTNDQLYTSSVINKIILDNKKVHNIKIENSKYFSFYSKSRLEEFKKNITNV